LSPHLLHVFATFAPGGPQVRTVGLMKAMGDGWRHSVVAMDGRVEAAELLPAELGVRILPAPPKVGAPGMLRHLRSLIRAERPDLLLTYNWGSIEAVVAGRLAGARRILHHEDGFRPDEQGGFKKRRVLARRLVLRLVRDVVVPSDTLRRIATELWRLPPARVHFIPNGIHLDEFAAAGPASPSPVREELGIPPDAFVVGSVGHLRGEKCFPRLVAAVASMARADAHLLLVGDGPERAAIEEAARERGLAGRLHLVGHRERTQPYYGAMDAFAMSSDTEQMPVALLEAMAVGRAVAATAVGDIAAMLPPEQADCLVAVREPETAAGLGAALEKLAADPGLRARLGAYNRSRVEERYGFGTMLSAYDERYRAALR